LETELSPYRHGVELTVLSWHTGIAAIGSAALPPVPLPPDYPCGISIAKLSIDGAGILCVICQERGGMKSTVYQTRVRRRRKRRKKGRRTRK